MLLLYGVWMVRVSEINGKKVITTDAFNVGKVSGAEMDDQWKITHVYVDLTKDATNELGFKKPVLGHVTICLPVRLIQGLGDVVTLSKTREGLKGTPECKGS
jgi:sporulation protein YlmC with PRC-barrel domain